MKIRSALLCCVLALILHGCCSSNDEHPVYETEETANKRQKSKEKKQSKGKKKRKAMGEDDSGLPKVGSKYVHNGANYIVAGRGKKPFTYTATGESLEIVVDKTPGTIVIVPKKGELVKVDAGVPMVWVGGKEHKEFKTNKFLQKSAKNKVIYLLEYDR